MNDSPLSIKVFLARGSATALRTAEISNWSGKAVGCSRSELADLSQRDEAGRPGVYVLIGIDPISGDSAAYVGEAEEVGKRLKQHMAKDFWSQAILFVSKDDNLTKAHIKYLEGRLIAQGLEAGRGVLLNAQASGAKLPEADEVEMDTFLDNMLRLLPVLGSNLFTPVTDAKIRSRPRLHCTIKGLTAHGNRTEGGFAVYKGSPAVLKERQSAGVFADLRARLIETRILALEGDHYVFTKDHEFSSPSYAAAVVCGGHTNGLTAWKNENGQTLKQLEDQGSQDS